MDHFDFQGGVSEIEKEYTVRILVPNNIHVHVHVHEYYRKKSHMFSEAKKHVTLKKGLHAHVLGKKIPSDERVEKNAYAPPQKCNMLV